MTSSARTPEGLDVDRFRTRLEEMKTQLEADIQNNRQNEVDQDGGTAEPGSGQHWEHAGYGDHQADDATELFEREKMLTLEGTLSDHLRLVEHALSRIADGSYGTCEVCGRAIPVERLEAIPETTLCLEHKEAAERKGNTPGRAHAANAWNAET